MPIQNVAIRSDGGNPSFGQGDLSHVSPRSPCHTPAVSERVWEREDVEAVIAGVWDIKMLLIQLVQLLGDDEEEADE
jgi:hypothetical protein